MEPMPEGTRALVDDAVAESAQTLFSAADVPLARTEELLKALQGPAVRAVLEARVSQIVKHGHTVESDLGKPTVVASAAVSRLQAARDVMVPGDRQNLPVARRRLADVAAMCLACIDVIDANGGQ